MEESVIEITKKIIAGRFVDEIVVSAKHLPLHSHGHFTSTVIALEVCLENTSDSKCSRIINLVAKVLKNKTDSYLELAFKKENEMYSSLIPIYKSISQRPVDENLLPKYFGTNISSTKDGVSIILLENLQHSGYKLNTERYLDIEHTKLVLDKMSYLHALGMALKFRDPKIFENNFKDLIEPALLNANRKKGERDIINMEFRKEMEALLKKIPKVEKFTRSVDDLLQKIDKMRIPEPKEPFSTLIHNDLWNNNILFKYSETDSLIPVDLSFIDFQFVLYNSPIRDVTYFIFSSSAPSIQADFHNVSLLYYRSLVKYLTQLHCDTTLLTEHSFLQEVKEYAPTKLKHLILLMRKTPATFEERLMNLITCYAELGWL